MTFATEKRKREQNEGKITRFKREWKPVAKVNEKRERVDGFSNVFSPYRELGIG